MTSAAILFSDSAAVAAETREERKRRLARERWRRWYANNPEKAREKSARYHANNPEKARERVRRRRERNPEVVREGNRRWREKSREKIRESRRLWREKNPEKVREMDRKGGARYRANNPEKVRERKRRWYERNLEHVREYKRQYRAKQARIRASLALSGENLKAALLQNELYAEASRHVPAGLPDFIRDDIVSDIVIAVLDGEFAVTDIARKAKAIMAAYWRQFGDRRLVSLDAELTGTDFRRIDTISNEDALYA